MRNDHKNNNVEYKHDPFYEINFANYDHILFHVKNLDPLINKSPMFIRISLNIRLEWKN